MRARPTWRIVLGSESRALWLGGRGLWLLLGVTSVLGVMTYVTASDTELNLLDARESVAIVTQTAIVLGALLAMVAAADAISGERERGTLEALLVTPMSRRGFVVGKLLAATSLWAGTAVATLPYLVVLGRGPGLVVEAVLALLVVGTLTALALAGVALAVSSVARSNRASLAITAALLIVLGAPSLLPAIRPETLVGTVLVRANPISAGLLLARTLLLDRAPWSSQLALLVAPAVGAVLATTLAARRARHLTLGGGS